MGAALERDGHGEGLPPANSHMDNLGNELHPTPDKPSDETIAQLAT